MTPLLRAHRVTARHPGTDRDVLRDVSVEVRPGEILAFLGPNGSGKSTLIGVLAGHIEPRSGHVELEGRPIRSMRKRAFARRVAHLPQDPSGPEGLTVASLVMGGRHPHLGLLGVERSEDRRAVRIALEAMDLADLAQRPLERLSGGERRRAWLAMTLAQGADVMLLDEPTNALDLRHQWEVLETIARVARERGISVVAAIHDLEQAARVAHRVAVLHRGRLYEVGGPERCLREDMLRDVFGVDARVEKTDGVWRLAVNGPADPVRSL